MRSLNSDHLRTFLAIHEAGSVTGGAARIGRSQSAASLQIRQLEAVIGTPLFVRHGRGVTLTVSGEKLRSVAQKVTRSLDATLAELRGETLRGRLRIGMPDDDGHARLAQILAEFASRHREVELEVQCALGAGFDADLAAGRLDLAVNEVPEPGTNDLVLRQNHLVWMGNQTHDLAQMDPLPVAVFDRDCWWRDLALGGLDRIGRRHRIAVSCESAVGVRAAIKAGIAAGLLDESDAVEGLRPLPGLSLRHPTFLVLKRAHGARGAVCDAMSDAISHAFKAGREPLDFGSRAKGGRPPG
ncbi:MAG: LysR family transcriptional regulator [Pseudomonadota bacterium]